MITEANNRKFIGFEQSEEYKTIAMNRITEATRDRQISDLRDELRGLETAFDLWADCESIHADDQREQITLEIEEIEAEIERLENIKTKEDLS